MRHEDVFVSQPVRTVTAFRAEGLVGIAMISFVCGVLECQNERVF